MTPSLWLYSHDTAVTYHTQSSSSITSQIHKENLYSFDETFNSPTVSEISQAKSGIVLLWAKQRITGQTRACDWTRRPGGTWPALLPGLSRYVIRLAWVCDIWPTSYWDSALHWCPSSLIIRWSPQILALRSAVFVWLIHSQWRFDEDGRHAGYCSSGASNNVKGMMLDYYRSPSTISR
jgi:hypothetical protein